MLIVSEQEHIRVTCPIISLDGGRFELSREGRFLDSFGKGGFRWREFPFCFIVVSVLVLLHDLSDHLQKAILLVEAFYGADAYVLAGGLPLQTFTVAT